MSTEAGGASPAPAAAVSSAATPSAAQTTPAAPSAGAALPQQPAFVLNNRSGSTHRFPANSRQRHPWETGAPPGKGAFWKMGLPFLVFVTLGAWGYARVLQSRLDSQDSSGASNRLYGQSAPDLDPSSLATDPSKKRSNMPGPASAPRKLPTLAEEYAKATKDFETDFVNKRVPRVPGQSSGH